MGRDWEVILKGGAEGHELQASLSCTKMLSKTYSICVLKPYILVNSSRFSNFIYRNFYDLNKGVSFLELCLQLLIYVFCALGSGKMVQSVHFLTCKHDDVSFGILSSYFKNSDWAICIYNVCVCTCVCMYVCVCVFWREVITGFH